MYREDITTRPALPRLTLRLVLLVAALALGVALAQAADEPEAAPAKPLEGKELFKAHCKSCHGAKSEAGELTPMTLIAEQWEEVFAGAWAETHGAVAAPGAADKKLTDILDAETLEAIRKFCVDHAADSEQPMTCG